MSQPDNSKEKLSAGKSDTEGGALPRDLRFILELFLLNIFQRIVRIVLRRISLSLGRICGGIACAMCPRERGIAGVQIRATILPDHQPPESEALIKQVFKHVGQSVAELMMVSRILKEGFVDSDNLQEIQDIVKKGNGAIALSGHIGSIELLAAYYAYNGIPLTVVGRDSNYPSVNIFIDRMRKGYGVHTVLRNDANGARRIAKALRTGGIVAFLVDQDTSLDSTFAPFFGIDAASPSAPVRFALSFGAPILSSFIVRTDVDHHQIISRIIPVTPKGEVPESVREVQVMTELNTRLAELIRVYPEQWIWWHRRWRRRPDINYAAEPEKLPSTKVYLEWLATGHK